MVDILIHTFVYQKIWVVVVVVEFPLFPQHALLCDRLCPLVQYRSRFLCPSVSTANHAEEKFILWYYWYNNNCEPCEFIYFTKKENYEFRLHFMLFLFYLHFDQHFDRKLLNNLCLIEKSTASLTRKF